MRTVTIEAQLEVPWSSNLVLSSDGHRVFGVSPDGSLWSVEVPRSATDAVVPRRELQSKGRIVAVDWQEDRLATIVLEDGQLHLSHGHGGFDGDPSRPATLSLAQARVPLAETGALQVYLRWWQEVDPMLGTVCPTSLLRGDDGHLYALPVWQGWTNEIEASTSCIGRDVEAMAGAPEHKAALFVGRLEPSIKPGLDARWFGRKEERAGAFLLSRQMSFAPGRLLRFGPAANAFVGFAGGRFARSHLLIAARSSPGDSQWSIWHVYIGYSDPRDPPLVVLNTRDDVLGVVANHSAEPFLVVRDDAASLSLVNGVERVALVRARASIRDVVTSTTAPLVAYVTAGSTIGFAWIDEDFSPDAS